MTLPNAPLSTGGDKLFHVNFDLSSVNTAAVIASVREKTVNSETFGYMGIGTHIDTDTHASGDQLVLIGGIDGTDIVPLDVDSNGAVKIGDVIPGTAATNLGKAEDVAFAGGDVGVAAMAVRTDTAVNRSGTDGDYEPLQIAAGRLWTSATIDAAIPTGSNTIGEVTIGTATTAATDLAKAEDAPHTTGDVGVMALGVQQSADTAFAADLDYVPLQLDATGFLKVNIKAGSTAGTEFNEDTVHSTGAAGTLILGVRNDTLATLTNADGDYASLQISAIGAAYVEHSSLSVIGGGTEAAAMRVTIASDSTGVITVDNGGTFAVQVDAALPTGANTIGEVTIGTATTAATDLAKAEDAVHATNDVGVMALAVQQSADSSFVGADGDYAPLQLDATGFLKVNVKAGSASGTEFDEDVPHTTGDAGVMALGVLQAADSSTAGTDGDYQPMIFDASGFLKVNVKAGSAGGTEFNEDTGHTTGDAGTQVLAVRNDTLGTLVGANLDYAPFQVSGSGALYVEHSSLSVIGGGTEAAAMRVTIANDSTGVISVDDNGASLTVDNATLSVTGGGVEASALRVTIANDSTGVLSIDDNGGAITIDGSVDILAGSATIGEVTIGLATTAATDLAKAEDAPHSTNDVGVMALAVQQSADSSFVGADGDYAPLQLDATGFLKVNIKAGSAGGTEFNEDDAHTTGDAGTQILAVRNDTLAALAGADGDYAPFQVNAEGALFVCGNYREDIATPAVIEGVAVMMERDDALSALTPAAADWAGLRCDANGALWTHDDALDAAISGSELQVDVVASLPAGTNNIGDVDVLTVPAPLNVTGGGTEASALRVTIANDSTGVITVDGTVLVTLLAGSNTNEVVGDVAHNAVAVGNPVLMGIRANANEPAAVANADAVYVWGDQQGRVVITNNHPSVVAVDSTHGPKIVNITATSNTSIVAAPGAGLNIHVTNLFLSNEGSALVKCDVKDGTTTRMSANLAADGGGVNRDFNPPWKVATNTALNAALSATGDVDVNVHYFTSA
jgi:predicted nucleic-acid-binding Zn-ribbon protein